MRKIFTLSHPKKKKDRLFEEAINEAKKYIKRERKKELPENFDVWVFDCKFGTAADTAEKINQTDIPKYILAAREQDVDSFYLEIIARPGLKALLK